MVTLPQQRAGDSQLSRLLDGCAALTAGDERMISGIALDSRRVSPGACFFALGDDPNRVVQHISQAVARGAVAVVMDAMTTLEPEVATPVIRVVGLAGQLGSIAADYFGRPSESLAVMAVTGTNGKTTVAHSCAQALSYCGRRCGYLGTLGAGSLDALVPTGMTTPDPITLQATLAAMLADGCRAVAMEASSHSLAQSRLAGTQIDVAVFTGLGHDHLDYHGDLFAYAAAKRSLFMQAGLKHAILNADDPRTSYFSDALAPTVQRWLYSLQPPLNPPASTRYLVTRRAAYRADNTILEIESSAGNARLTSKLIGDFNAQNILATLGALLAFEIPFPEACSAMESVLPVTGRLEGFGGQLNLPRVYVDYAHSPDSLERVLRVLRSFAPAQLICVFGCGGERDRSKRPLMGAIAERYADRVFVTADNPRSEAQATITAEILQGVKNPRQISVIEDRATAIAEAIALATAGDIVLVAGKGHESFQEIGGVRVPLSDQALVSTLLAVRG